MNKSWQWNQEMKTTQPYRKHNVAYCIMSSRHKDFFINIYIKHAVQFTGEENCLIKLVCQKNQWGTKRTWKEFSKKKSTVISVKDVLKDELKLNGVRKELNVD